MDIPIIISIKGNTTELQRELLGEGEEVKDEKLLEFIKEKSLRYVNKSTTISDGIILKHHPTIQKITESVETGFVDWHGIITIVDRILNLGISSFTIGDWLSDKLGNRDYKIKILDKEVKTIDEFQKTLDEYIKSHSDK